MFAVSSRVSLRQKKNILFRRSSYIKRWSSRWHMQKPRREAICLIQQEGAVLSCHNKKNYNRFLISPWWIRIIILFLTDVGLPPWKLLRFKEIRLLSQKLFFVSFITNARLLISDGSKELWLFHRCRNFITWDWFNLTYFIQSWNKEVKRSNFQFLKRCDTPILVNFRVFTSSPFQTRRLVNNSYKVEFL